MEFRKAMMSGRRDWPYKLRNTVLALELQHVLNLDAVFESNEVMDRQIEHHWRGVIQTGVAKVIVDVGQERVVLVVVNELQFVVENCLELFNRDALVADQVHRQIEMGVENSLKDEVGFLLRQIVVGLLVNGIWNFQVLLNLLVFLLH